MKQERKPDRIFHNYEVSTYVSDMQKIASKNGLCHSEIVKCSLEETYDEREW